MPKNLLKNTQFLIYWLNISTEPFTLEGLNEKI